MQGTGVWYSTRRPEKRLFIQLVRVQHVVPPVPGELVHVPSAIKNALRDEKSHKAGSRPFFSCFDCLVMGSRTIIGRHVGSVLVLYFLHFGRHGIEAQESIRPSLAGSQSAEANKPAINPGQYNLQLGPALVGFSANVDLLYNDNIDLSETDRKSDLIIEPSVTANVLWQLTQDNTIRLNLGAAYVKYANYQQFDSSSVAIAPDSELAFDIYAGDFKFTIFDQLSIQQNPIDEIDLSRVVRFERLQNSAGLNVTWDLDKVIKTTASATVPARLRLPN